MKIVHVITNLATGGAEMTLFRLLRGSGSRFDSMVIALGDGGPVAELLREIDIRVVCLGGRGGKADPRLLWRAYRAIAREKPDIVQTWLYHADLIGLAAARAAHVRRVFWSVRRSAPQPEDYKRHWRSLLWMLARVSRFPTAVIANSQAGIAAHRQLGYRPKQWVLIPNGLEVDAFAAPAGRGDALRARWGVAAGDVVIGVLGRYHPVKGHDVFIDAAARVTRERKDVRVVLGGRGMEPGNETLVSKLREAGLLERATLLGEVRPASDFFPGIDVFCSPSHAEGFPNVIAEAMASRVPCVATDAGDARLVIGDTGLIVPPRDAPALAEALLRFVHMPAGDRAGYATRARQRIAAEYTIERMVESYSRLYSG